MNEISFLFQEQFGTAPIIARSPGRINIIGEHTDYNGGFVLPAAIDQYIYAAVAKNNSDSIRMYSVQYDERVEVSINNLQKRPGHWTTYILGVARELQVQQIPFAGFDILIDGNLPTGAGVSSSAAFECAVVKALIELFDLELNEDDIIGIARSAEHNFAGVMCGIMDQFASMRGQKDHALLLDCASQQYEAVPLHLNGYQLVLLNTNVKHSLASSAYNTRREECSEVVNIISKHHPNVRSLRDVTFNMIVLYVHDPVLFRRAKYVIEENDRVLRAVKYMRDGNIAGLGKQLLASHEGLSELYEVSCKELDWLVRAVRYRPEVAGARMMGGGFGGCTINIVRENRVEELINNLSADYEKQMGRSLSAYMVNTANGTELIHANTVTT